MQMCKIIKEVYIYFKFKSIMQKLLKLLLEIQYHIIFISPFINIRMYNYNFAKFLYNSKLTELKLNSM